MKKILITGANSYIGTSFEKWLKRYPDKYTVETVDMIGEGWKRKSFAGYDAVFHVAGIAHVSSGPKLKDLYYKVNRDLAIETAKKAKTEGVKQFIFMSSIIVYGNGTGGKKLINKNTKPNPLNHYGNSKLQAEAGIGKLEGNEFKAVIIRAPMIYGYGSKGNYARLSKLAQKIPIFFDFDNKRSMLHIDNLCEFVRLLIDNDESGIFYPQNEEYVKTGELVKAIAEVHGKKILLTKAFNPIIRLLLGRVEIANKVFGDLMYEKSMSDYSKANYRIRTFKESVYLSELGSGVIWDQVILPS